VLVWPSWTEFSLTHIRLQFHRQQLPHSMKPPSLNNHFIIPLPPLDADESLPEPPEPVSIPENPAVQPSGSLLFHSFGDTQPKAIGTISESYCIYEICFSCLVTFCHTSSTSKRIRHFRSLSKWWSSQKRRGSGKMTNKTSLSWLKRIAVQTLWIVKSSEVAVLT